MLPTLFHIPHTWLGWPLLTVWLVFSVIMIAVLYWRHGWGQETTSFFPVVALVGAVIWFVIPGVEVMGVNPDDPLGPSVNRGLVVRGYGVCMLLAILTGVGIVTYRCRKIGFPVDPILTLAFWMVIAGVVGARLFFVIQKRDQFFAQGVPWTTSLAEVINMTQGGLVVYGSLFGASLAAFVFFWWTKLPVWKTADLIAPGMAIGLAIGRIGCLLNGCCWGGVCSPGLPSVQFPAGAGAYTQHLTEGRLLGLMTQPVTEPTESGFSRQVTAVNEGVGKEIGVQRGDQIQVGVRGHDLEKMRFLVENDPSLLDQMTVPVVVQPKSASAGELPNAVAVPASQLPRSSLAVHPTQIYSSVNALLLCLLLWFYWPVRRADGQVFALMLVLYPVGRFLIEIIRSDEAGQFGTQLTISQLVSIGTVLLGLAMFFYCRRFVGRNIATVTGV